MQSGLINKVAITPANVTDAQAMKHVCPEQGAVYGDKGYCTAPARKAAKRKECYLAAVKKNNMKEKNQDQDRWYTGIRAPYERVFPQRNRRVRYTGVAKNQFAAFMTAICFNMKRLLVLGPPDLYLSQGHCAQNVPKGTKSAIKSAVFSFLWLYIRNLLFFWHVKNKFLLRSQQPHKEIPFYMRIIDNANTTNARGLAVKVASLFTNNVRI